MAWACDSIAKTEFSISMTSSRLTKLMLRLFIVSICATALVGIWAIAIPSDDWEYEFKIFLTTATIAGASVCGLACGGCLSRGHRILPMAGLVLSGIGAALILIGMWPELTSAFYWQVTCTISFFAVACAHLSMLLMANLASKYRWAQLLAYQLILGLATLLAFGIWFEFFESEGYWRFTGVVSILVAAITLIIPVLHYMSRDVIAREREQADPLFAVDEEIARLKKRLMELELKRNTLLGRAGAEDGSAR
jgi:hypothetical protein